MAKRTFEEIDEPNLNASVDGLIQEVSPIKKGKRSEYYEGKLLSSEKCSQRFVGFEKAQ